jgi:hypothetical protein
MTNNQKHEIGYLKKAFYLEDYKSLCGKFCNYQIDQDLFEARKSILSFVRGLRFSALLIYKIRKILSDTKCTADWGAIIDNIGDKCSPECDIIVHENGSDHAWNGGDDIGGRVMDFHFIKKQNVKLVVSCKGFKVTQIDKNMSDYIDNVWLFTECCDAENVTKLKKDAKVVGYKNLYYLYLLKEGQIAPDYDERIWFDFTESLLGIAKD